MKPLLTMDECLAAGADEVGGKAFSLARLYESGFTVPKTCCIPCRVYEAYLNQTRLRDKIFLEINRKSLKQMRWEEIWDVALRIRNYFLTTPIPAAVRDDLTGLIRRHCGETRVAVRSSAPGEDSAESSFAGLHDSFLNISGVDNILKHVRLVWASLYSDAALLYRKELGLDIYTSQMAVVLQELIPSDRSGVFFGINPLDSGESLIEAVYGLNQALVDGDIEPDRWTLDRSSGRVVHHTAPGRERCAVPSLGGISFTALDGRAAGTSPLNGQEVRRVWETGTRLESVFGRPQDMEWTFSNNRLIILQARPITSAGFNDTDDKRSWYLTLHRSFENLKALYDKIEHHLIPEMISDAARMGRQKLETLSSDALRREIEDRQAIYDRWVRIYWDDFIPFAHGIRLFGQVYNDAVTPEDPYEFMALLEDTGLKSMERNRLLEQLAGMIREDAGLKDRLEDGRVPGAGHAFRTLLDLFIDQFGDLSCATGSGSECRHGETAMIRLLLEFSKRPARNRRTDPGNIESLAERYMKRFSPERLEFAKDVLQLGRESYRLRDDDNIHLGRIEARLSEAIQEGQKRLHYSAASREEIDILSRIPALSLTPAKGETPKPAETDDAATEKWIKSRQIVGQPAGPGIASGKARLVKDPEDLLSFKQGEILVCAGVDPNMTFVIPLAAAIVEERGGMLIHGAIIAREYGLPCITGASNAMQRIENGNRITVDGYLGIITCRTDAL